MVDTDHTPQFTTDDSNNNDQYFKQAITNCPPAPQFNEMVFECHTKQYCIDQQIGKRYSYFVLKRYYKKGDGSYCSIALAPPTYNIDSINNDLAKDDLVESAYKNYDNIHGNPETILPERLYAAVVARRT